MSLTYHDETLDGGYRKISLTGSLDAPSTMAVEEKFQEIIKAEDKDAIVDLAGIEYASSYGLRMLLVAAREMHKRDLTLHLAAPNRHIRELIKLVGYDLAFPVHDTVEDAVTALGK